MGIPMDDIHTPSVAADPTSNGFTNGAASDTMSFRELTQEKERLESELKALSSVLDSHGVNMNTTLTTFDGYPRDDIDVPQIRTTRARIIYLRNDYKTVMSRIELAVHAQFARATERPSGSSQPSALATPSRPTLDSQSETPFALVNSVVANSPATVAGLAAGDKIITFGAATWLNHEKLAKVAQIVSQNEGTPIPVTIQRNTQVLHLALTPRSNWGGRGTLGCHLLPL